MSEALTCAFLRGWDFISPLWYGVAQSANVERETRAWQRCVNVYHHVHERIDPGPAFRLPQQRRFMLMRAVNPDPVLASHHAHQAAIVQRVEHLRGGVRRTAPVIPNAPVRKVFLNLARMHLDARLEEGGKQICFISLGGRPRLHSFRWEANTR